MSVSTDVQGDIAIIRFDDGNKNVINHELLDDLEHAFDQTEHSQAKSTYSARTGGLILRRIRPVGNGR